MAYCVHCGEEIGDGDVCPHCDTPQRLPGQDEGPTRTGAPGSRDRAEWTGERPERAGDQAKGAGNRAKGAGDRATGARDADTPNTPAADPDPSAGGQKRCTNCGAELDSAAELCPDCGVRQPEPSGDGGPSNEQIIVGILAITFGWFGVHKFYQGNVAWGVIYLCFFWTGIPWFLSFIEGILILVADEAEYERTYADGSVLGA